MVFLRAVSAICYPRASSTQCQPGDGLILGQSSSTGPALSQRWSGIACRLSSLSSAVIGLIFPRFQLAGLIPSFVQATILYRCPENNPTFNELIASTRVGGRKYGRGLATHPSTLEVNCDIHAAKSLNPYLYTLKLSSALPGKRKIFAWHWYNVGPTFKTLGRRCTHVRHVCWVVLFCCVLLCSVPFRSVPFRSVLFCSVFCCVVLLCCVVLCCVVLYCVVLCSVLFCSVLFCFALL